MAALLRSIKSTIHAPFDFRTQNKAEGTRNKQSGVTEVAPSQTAENSFNQTPLPFLDRRDPSGSFKRKLTRKPSTYSLRTRHRQASKDLVIQATSGSDTFVQDKSVARQRDSTVKYLVTQAEKTESPSATELGSLLLSIRKKQNDLVQKGYIHHYTSGNVQIARMAPAAAAPPVPYTRLQDITVSACEKALSGVTSYAHTSTEDWNTTIINNILGTLVKETTPTSSTTEGTPAQPSFKYVVNSTIIQHAPTSASNAAANGTNTVAANAGRRGMHAASGAYWNNEKDGMWSYKYSAAEKQGLDVVVGITWIWVG